MNIYERKEKIINIVNELDISPTLFNNAVEKYENIAKFLESNGINAEFYPQGSFALGTVVRPNIKNREAGYDLDAVCKVFDKKKSLSASDLFTKISDVFLSSKVYRDKVKIYPKCITIEYAEINSICFSIDIIPAVEEEEIIKQEQKLISNRPDLIQTSISIPKHCSKYYTWFTNNPKGYKTWFDEVNEPFFNYVEKDQKRRIFETNRNIYQTVEQIPSLLVRTPLQRVIQILKRNRDSYFLNIKNGDELKPLSALITTLATEISKSASYTLDTFDLLDYVVSELVIYSGYNKMDEMSFRKQNPLKSIIQKENGKWIIANPALPLDNLADGWNEDPKKVEMFFKWLSFLRKDLLASLHEISDDQFLTFVSNVLGVQNHHKLFKQLDAVTAPKPWKGTNEVY